MEDPELIDPIRVPIDGELDLHTFSPRELKYLLPDYIEECLKSGIYSLRIIHGKGTGVLRERVHGILKKHPDVAEYGLASAEGGGWGATLVRLKKA